MKEKFQKVLEMLGLVDKAKAQQLSDEEWKKIVDSYKKQFNSDFYADMAKSDDTIRKAAAHDRALELIHTATAPEGTDEDAPAGDDAAPGSDASQQPDLTAQVQKLTDQNKGLKTEVQDLKGKVETLSKTTEPDVPNKIINMKIAFRGGQHTAKHAFGIEHPMFDANKRWNQILITGAIPQGMPATDDEENFQKEVKNYGHQIALRMQSLHRQGLLNPSALNPKSDLVTYNDLANAGLGEQYIVRRQDALIVRIIELPTVKNIFPVRYGIQDQEIITNAFFGEFSQAYQEGEVFKGSVSLQPEKGYVDDAMMKTKFESLKWIERQYIGYLNTNGSDPIKWNMIEWMLLNIATKLIKEQNERNVVGIYRHPRAGVAGHYLHSANGVVYSLIRYVNELKVLPFDAAGFSTYDSTTVLTVVENFVEEVKKYLPSLAGFSIYLNANHKKWYANCYRTAYGTDLDFKGVDLNQVIDEDVQIIWVPNMGQLKFMWFTQPGNIQTLEFLPGEMFKINFEQRLENVLAWSVWKEGVSGAFTGKRFTTIAELQANAYADQILFINKPVTTLADDVTTCDGSVNIWFKTVANTTADKNITDITGAKAGKAYIIETGSTTKPQTVDKAGKFDQITADYAPTAVGDYLMVVYDEGNSKFYELERRVGGTRTINAATQPHLPA